MRTRSRRSALFQKSANAAGAPQRNHVRLGDQQDGVGKIAKLPRRLIQAAGAVHDHVTEVCHQQIEQAGQFGRRWVLVLRLLRTGEQLQAAFALGHQTFKQRGIQPVQVLQRVHHAKRGPHVEMERAMSEGSKIHQQNSALGFLQRDRGVDRYGGAARSALGIHHGEDAGAAR